MCVYLCMHTQIYVYNVCSCIHDIYVYIQNLYEHVYVYICVYTYIYGHIYLYIHVYVFMYICTYVCVNTFI